MYGIVAIPNQKAAQDAGWGGVDDQKIFTLEGPRGTADAALVCQGSPIRGLDPQGGARKLYLDMDLYRLTGLWTGLLPTPLQEEFTIDELGEPTTKSKTTIKVDVTTPPSELDGLPKKKA